ncbi:MAG TPA: dienelactone hydrolase family protein [Polyangiaceae bacterium]|nr:dienelactone hydrolase family protein [Polyangiaceae bacterium]
MRRLKIADLEVMLGGGTDREGGGRGPMLVLMHGFGAPGGDLVPLARQLAVDPSVRFCFPAAPHLLEPGEPAEHAGRAWWQIDMLELQRAMMQGDYEAFTSRIPAGLIEARAQVQALLEALERDHGVTPGKLVLGGFSQGAMLATDVTLHAALPPAALVILSGSFLAKREWLPLMNACAGLPVLQSHGRADPVLSYQLAEQLRDELEAAGAEVAFHAFNGGHGIPGSVIEALGPLLDRFKS